MVPDPQLPDWLAYLDVDTELSRFTGGEYIVTDAFTHRTVGAVGGSAWQMEEWSVKAVLVPLRRLQDAQRTLTHHDLGLEPSWIDRKHFDFGLSARIKGIPVRFWSYMRKHPATDQRLVEIQRDFVTYHALDQRRNGDEYEMVHPLEGLTVVRVRIQKIAFYNPTLMLEVHRDYLRDYLAATGLAVLIGAVSNRFRNAKTPDRLSPPPGQTPTDVEFSLHGRA